MEIIWSDMALHQLDGILDYVEEHFGASVSRKTLDDINSKVGRLLRLFWLFVCGLVSPVRAKMLRPFRPCRAAQ